MSAQILIYIGGLAIALMIAAVASIVEHKQQHRKL